MIIQFSHMRACAHSDVRCFCWLAGKKIDGDLLEDSNLGCTTRVEFGEAWQDISQFSGKCVCVCSKYSAAFSLSFLHIMNHIGSSCGFVACGAFYL